MLLQVLFLAVPGRAGSRHNSISVQIQLAFTTITKMSVSDFRNALFKESVATNRESARHHIISLVGSVSYNNQTNPKPHHAVSKELTNHYKTPT